MTSATQAATNFVWFAVEPTAVEKYCEPVQPPIVRRAFTFYGAHETLEKRDTGMYSRSDAQLERMSGVRTRPNLAKKEY